jgi:diadenosine tetraphosphate (Ap4A) HIT family hydrolase
MSNWDELLNGKNCHLCGLQPDANEYKIKIAPLRISTLYLFRDQRFRGYCLLVFDRYHATSLVQLSLDEYRAFTEDLRQAGAALEAALRPDHMNYELLGNSGPHLHWHIIPRYRNDPRWGRPVWEGWPRNEFNINRVVLSDPMYQDLIARIRACLAKT